MAAQSPKFTKLLAEWLPRTGNWSVCWRTTRDGNKTEIFHDRCNSKVPTLTIVKVLKDNKTFIFGGFTTATWAPPLKYYRSAPGSFLFSFRNNDNLPPFKLPLKDPNSRDAILARKDSGPTFGHGPDLSIFDKNVNFKTYESYANPGYIYQVPPGYTAGENKTRALLAGSLIFTPAEVEVLYLN
ncbi:uncharacterized protein LOC114526080 [Dendronephthya gigantea]|uniref:uncharacterized protein LOC114526080 n=1 Tax=Dendronephthya gigantea TaxID=151771 RepID=UPI00106B17E1|nr:uncharacterized protein LOC114526080 [Dendronephthya gigantea]